MTAADLAFLGGGLTGAIIVGSTLVRATAAFQSLRLEMATSRATVQVDLAVIRGAAEVALANNRTTTDKLAKVEADVNRLRQWKHDDVTRRLLRIDELWLSHERMPPRK